ncbi:MAG TPA: hypothetical protein VGL83_05090 [Stellaceae bacterium]|jgi:hypothetical protein
MVYRKSDLHGRWPEAARPFADRDARPEDTPANPASSLSLQDALTELALTVVGFVAAIVLITAVLNLFHLSS